MGAAVTVNAEGTPEGIVAAAPVWVRHTSSLHPTPRSATRNAMQGGRGWGAHRGPGAALAAVQPMRGCGAPEDKELLTSWAAPEQGAAAAMARSPATTSPKLEVRMMFQLGTCPDFSWETDRVNSSFFAGIIRRWPRRNPQNCLRLIRTSPYYIKAGLVHKQ